MGAGHGIQTTVGGGATERSFHFLKIETQAQDGMKLKINTRQIGEISDDWETKQRNSKLHVRL